MKSDSEIIHDIFTQDSMTPEQRLGIIISILALMISQLNMVIRQVKKQKNNCKNPKHVGQI